MENITDEKRKKLIDKFVDFSFLLEGHNAIAADIGIPSNAVTIMGYIYQAKSTTVKEVISNFQGDVENKRVLESIRQRIVKAIIKLEKLGVVTKTKSPDDKRIVTISLTPKGKSMLEAYFEHFGNHLQAQEEFNKNR